MQVQPAPPLRRTVTTSTQTTRRQIQPAPPRTPETPDQGRSLIGQTVQSAAEWFDNVVGGVQEPDAAPARQPRAAPQPRQQQVASAPARHQEARTTYKAPKKPAQRSQAATAGGGYVIQLAARQRRSDAEAAARTASARHGSVLGGAKPYIVRADIAGKGTYYRVRVGPYRTKAQVSSICAQLKSKGQDCFATR
ncbi:MAG: SPOR domain-containing protein [Hyphomicrobiales bacterium]